MRKSHIFWKKKNSKKFTKNGQFSQIAIESSILICSKSSKKAKMVIFSSKKGEKSGHFWGTRGGPPDLRHKELFCMLWSIVRMNGIPLRSWYVRMGRVEVSHDNVQWFTRERFFYSRVVALVQNGSLVIFPIPQMFQGVCFLRL